MVRIDGGEKIRSQSYVGEGEKLNPKRRPRVFVWGFRFFKYCASIFFMKNNYTYTIKIDPVEDGGYVVTVPALPGCITQGESYEEALANAKECVQGFLEALVKAGQPLPKEPRPMRSMMASIKVSPALAI